MPGKRGPEFGDFVTPFEEYRRDIAAADAVPVQDPAIPLLDTLPGANVNVGLGQADVNQYGRNAQMNLAVIIAGFSAVELELWLNAVPTRARLHGGTTPVSSSSSSVSPTPSSSSSSPSSSSSSSSSSSPTDTWVRVATKTFGSVSELWVVKDIPPGEYKIKVASVTGNGNVTINESHAT